MRFASGIGLDRGRDLLGRLENMEKTYGENPGNMANNGKPIHLIIWALMTILR